MPNGCWVWVWVGGSGVDGYGVFSSGRGKIIRASRFSYEYFRGKLGRLFACHSCDNILCVNPSHLFPGTNLDNMVDASKKGRLGRKLTKEIVLSIRNRHKNGERISSMLPEFDITYENLRKAVVGLTWKYLPL